MKNKIAITILVLIFLLFGVKVFADIEPEWTRVPAGTSVFSPITYTGAKATCLGSDLQWVLLQSGEYEAVRPSNWERGFYSNYVNSTSSENVYTLEVPTGNYYWAYFTCGTLVQYNTCAKNDYQCADGGGDIEYSGDVNPIFSIPFINFSLGIVSSTVAYIGQTVSGLGPLLYLIMGIPLGFYVVRKLIGFIPKR